jgi:hypothetical protein
MLTPLFKQEKHVSMFNDNEIVDDEDEDEYYVTLLPGSNYEMEFDKDQDWMEYNIPVPKQQHKANLDLVPSSLLVAKSVNGKPSLRLLKVLFDSGGTKTTFNRRCLPDGAMPYLLSIPAIGTTAAGAFNQQQAYDWKIAYFPNLVEAKEDRMHQCNSFRCSNFSIRCYIGT